MGGHLEVEIEYGRPSATLDVERITVTSKFISIVHSEKIHFKRPSLTVSNDWIAGMSKANAHSILAQRCYNQQTRARANGPFTIGMNRKNERPMVWSIWYQRRWKVGEVEGDHISILILPVDGDKVTLGDAGIGLFGEVCL